MVLNIMYILSAGSQCISHDFNEQQIDNQDSRLQRSIANKESNSTTIFSEVNLPFSEILLKIHLFYVFLNHFWYLSLCNLSSVLGSSSCLSGAAKF